MNHLNYNAVLPWAILLCVGVARLPQLWLADESEGFGAPAPQQATPPESVGITVPADQDAAPRSRLYAAIRAVESGGDDFAVGDSGTSRGPYQIGLAYWRDGCEAGGVQWDYQSLVWSAPHCEYIMFLYWERYGAKTDEQRARIHNGGPTGMSKDSTLGYWNRVKEMMR